MGFRLRNQKDANRVLCLTRQTWFAVLDLAESYGWYPLGDMWPGDWGQQDFPSIGYGPDPLLADLDEDENYSDRSLVVFEDALNLADVLERAFLEMEPQRVPISFFLGVEYAGLENRPAIGVLTAVIEFCRLGSFWVEMIGSQPA